MYAYIKGELVHATTIEAIVDVGGVGYRINIPLSIIGQLPPIGHEVLLYTSFIVREQSQALFGFISTSERDVFELLLGVSGIGPKLALSIIGHLPVHDLQLAISSGDVKSISKVPGIGKKTAEKLIIEMRDKLKLALPPDPSELAVHFSGDVRSQTAYDAISALLNLGYSQSAAHQAIKKTLHSAPDLEDLGSLIAEALKHV